jgi:hypothetical protein
MLKSYKKIIKGFSEGERGGVQRIEGENVCGGLKTGPYL